MRVVKLSDEAHAAAQAKHGDAYNIHHIHEEVNAIFQNLNTPVELSTASKVAFDSKTDRYTVTFTSRDRTVTLKVTNKVAEFVTANIREAGYWRLRMEEGV